MAGLWSDHFPAGEKTPERFSPCKTKGTWSELFPSAEKHPSPAPPTPPLAPSQRCLLCRTCGASCRLFTSNTPQNPNRQFYKCSAYDHKFFKWADEVRPDELIDVPYCGGCTAGVCRVRKEKSGPNAGRIMFMCRVKEGEGSCGYRVWQDELETSAMGRANANLTSPQSPTIKTDYYTRPANTNLVEENMRSNEKANNESPMTNTSKHLNCHGATSSKVEHLIFQENQRDESLRRAQRPLDGRVPSFQSPSPTVKSNCTKPANTGNVGADNESPEIDTWQHLNRHGATSRKTEQLKRQENQRNKSSERAQRLSDVRITLFQTPTVTSDHTVHANADLDHLVEENYESNEGADNESPVIDTPQLKCQENQPHESSRRPHKRSRHGDLKAPSSLVSSQSLTVGPPLNSVSVEHCWMVAAIRQNLSTQLQGWWGRLAFHPRPCLVTNASKPLTCYVSSPPDKILVNSGDLTTLTSILLGIESYNKPPLNPCHNTQLSTTKPLRVALHVSSCSDPSTDTIENAMSESISKAFGQAAEHLQDDFLSLLDKMDVGDYEAMSRAAEATFAALDRLLFNYQDFKGRTKEYIHCASSLAEIERSMPGNESYQKLIEHCSSERMRLDEINWVHANAVDSVNDSKKRLKSLQEEVSSTMDWLFQVEAELSCCEVEMRNMERELEKICKSKEVLEESYLIAANELDRSKMLLEQKEAERDAAKAAFERARELLRG